MISRGGTLRIWYRCIAARIAAAAGIVCLVTSGCGKQELERQLQARLASGELGGSQCAVVTSNMRPDDRGFEDIRYDWLPGAHRVVLARRANGWRMVSGAPELALFTQAGYFAMADITFKSADGSERPAREFRLTRKGYDAMLRPGCFEYASGASLEITAITEAGVPERLSGMGKAFRVKYRLKPRKVASWADTPEFRYVYSKIYTSPDPQARPPETERIFFNSNGRWLDEREAMMQLMLDASELRQPQAREMIEKQRATMAADTPEKRAKKVRDLTPDALRSRVLDAQRRHQLAPCFDLVRNVDATSVWKKGGPAIFAFYEHPSSRRKKARRENALELFRRLEKAGLAHASRFSDQPFTGGRPGAGVSYVLDEALAAALDARRGHCLPLGEFKVESIRPVVIPGTPGIKLKGWAQLTDPRPWTAALATHFPSVRALVENGYGISGTVRVAGDQEMIQLQAHVPIFELKVPTKEFRPGDRPVAVDGPAIVDLTGDGAVRMSAQGCSISADGTEVSAGTVSCTGARATRGFRKGKAYAEISFRAKQPGGVPDTWTNAALTSARHMSSVSTGAALFSFAGSRNKSQVKDGDLVGVALDMDEYVLYWHLNGEWRTGRPGSGIGEPVLYAGEEYFIAVSVQSKAEAWRINFGASPFRFVAPSGYPAYSAPAR